MVEAIALIALLLIVGLVLFQLALGFGAPLGRFAWGGKFPHKLPWKFRLASFVAAGLLIIFGLFATQKAGWISLFDQTIVSIGLWVIFAQLLLNTLGNVASKSTSERVVMAPISVILVICFLVLATS